MQILKAKNKRFNWAALAALFTLIFGIFASAQEIPCALSFVGDSPATGVHSTTQHSAHCIRHQNPLPQYESTPQLRSSVSKPDLSKALFVIVASALQSANFKSSRNFPAYNVTNAHVGVPVYKFFAHFLI